MAVLLLERINFVWVIEKDDVGQYGAGVTLENSVKVVFGQFQDEPIWDQH